MNQLLNYIDFVQKTITSHKGLSPGIHCPAPQSDASNILLRATNSFSYVVDYRTGGYAFMSSSFSDVANHSVQRIKNEGIRYYSGLIHQQDWEVINGSIFKAICCYLEEHRKKPNMRHRFIFNYRLQQANGQTLSIRQINNFLETDEEGWPLVNAGVCTLIPYQVPNFKITYLAQSLNEKQVWENEDVKTFTPSQSMPQQLSPAELKILHWIKNGYSSEKIAEKLNRSLHTIKTHRKNMLEKTCSRNTAELLQFSLAHGI